MNASDPFHVHIITSLIASNLSTRDLRLCIRVCKAWHNIFLPFLWKEVYIKTCINVTQPPNPTPSVLERHSHLVRNLKFSGIAHKDFMISYSNLQTLSLVIAGDPTDLITLNPSIVHLSVCNEENLSPSISRSFWQAVANLHQLATLFLDFGTVLDAFVVADVWKACTRLEMVTLLYTEIDCKAGIPSSFSFPRIRELVLESIFGMHPEYQLDMIRRCPNLERLVWVTQSEGIDLASKALVEFVKSGVWWNIKSLELLIDLQDDEVASILKGVNRVFNLDLEGSGFGCRAIEALRSHFGSLRELNLSSCRNVGSRMIQEILCTSPQLETFKADYLAAGDVVEGRPWVCLSMRILKVCFVFGKSNRHITLLIYERLSSLTRLTSLDVGHSLDDERGLDIQLEAGLGKLRSLKHMEYLDANNIKGTPGVAELEWMSASWKSLKWLRCNIDIDPSEFNRKKYGFCINYY